MYSFVLPGGLGKALKILSKVPLTAKVEDNGGAPCRGAFWPQAVLEELQQMPGLKVHGAELTTVRFRGVLVQAISHNQTLVLCHSSTRGISVIHRLRCLTTPSTGNVDEGAETLTACEAFAVLPTVLHCRGWTDVLHIFEPKCAATLAAALFSDLCGLEQLLNMQVVRVEARGVEIKVMANNSTGRLDQVPSRILRQLTVVRCGGTPASFSLRGKPFHDEDGSIRLKDEGHKHAPMPCTEYMYELRQAVTAVPIQRVQAVTGPALPSVPKLRLNLSNSNSGCGTMTLSPSTSVHDIW